MNVRYVNPIGPGGVLPGPQHNNLDTKMSQPNSQSKAWLFTWNLPDDLTEQEQLDWDPHPEEVLKDYDYMIYQWELGTNLHLQGYVFFSDRKRLTQLKKLYPDEIHWDRRKGTHTQAKHYCSKPHEKPCKIGCHVEHACPCHVCKQERKDRTVLSNTCVEFGSDDHIPDASGTRMDLEKIKDKVDSKISMEQIWDEDFSTMVQWHKGIEKYNFIKTKDRDPNVPIHVELHVGVPGSGKTRHASEKYPNAYWLSGTKWWDGYESQSEVIIDDFYGWIPYHQFLRVIDRYPYTCEVKGGTRKLVATKFIITSNKPPEEWYDYVKIHGSVSTINRRINEVYEYHKDMSKENEFIVLKVKGNEDFMEP